MRNLTKKTDSLDDLFNNHILPIIEERFIKFTREYIDNKSTTISDPKRSFNQIEDQFHQLQYMHKSIELLSKISSNGDYQEGLKSVISSICKGVLTNLFNDILTYQLIHSKLKIDLNKLNNHEERSKIIYELKDNELITLFTGLNDCLSGNNFSDFINSLIKNNKNMAISLKVLDKKKEKQVVERITNDFKKVIQEKTMFLVNLGKKEFSTILVDITQLALIKTNIYINVGYEIGVITSLQKLFFNADLLSSDYNALLKDLFMYNALSEEGFNEKQNEISEVLTKILNYLI